MYFGANWWIFLLIFGAWPLFGWRRRLRGRLLDGGDWAGRGLVRQKDLDQLLDEIRQRDDTIALLEQRLSEVENRLDFTERMLANPTEPERVG